MSRYSFEDEYRSHELRRKPKKIQGVPFVYHNGTHYMYKCKYADPMIQMADSLKNIIVKRNAALKKAFGPFILEGMNWSSVTDLVAFIKKIFYEIDGRIYWNVTYVTPKQIHYPGDIAERRYAYALVKFMGRTFTSHSIVWALHNNEYAKDLIHINGDNLDNRISNLA